LFLFARSKRGTFGLTSVFGGIRAAYTYIIGRANMVVVMDAVFCIAKNAENRVRGIERYAVVWGTVAFVKRRAACALAINRLFACHFDIGTAAAVFFVVCT